VLWGANPPFTKRFTSFHSAGFPVWGCSVVGVAGWNTANSCWDIKGFGTLLGPEGTPAGWVLSLAVPVSGDLTLAGGVWVVVAVVSGCGCLLSVA